MSLLDSNKVLGKETFNTFSSINIGGDAGIVTGLDTLNCIGYNYVKFKVRSLGSGGKLWLQKSIDGENFVDVKPVFVYNSSNAKNRHQIIDGIFETGEYILDVTDALFVQFVRKETVPSVNITFDIARLSTQLDILPKIMQIATGMREFTSSQTGSLIYRADISMFRFIVVRIKTIPQTGESSSVRTNARVSLMYRFDGVEYTDYPNYWEENVLTLDNYYVAVSDWLMPKSDKVDVTVSATDADAEHPKKFEVTLMGIR